MVRKSLVDKIGDFFEISANVNFASVVPYIGSLSFSLYNILDGHNKYDGTFSAVSALSLVVGLAVSKMAYAIYKGVARDIEGSEELAKISGNRILKNAIALYKKRKAQGKEK